MQTNPSMAGERKLVTVLFADISGFTAMSDKMDPELVRERINLCFERLAPVVRKHEGLIEKYIGDEIMAIFGAPVVHENDAERAALAALEMKKALSAYNREFSTNLSLHMGMNTGGVIAGGIGAQDDLQYGVLGDTVNTAARLADAAESGQIFVGESTHKLIASEFELQALEPIRVRGKSSLVAVFLLQGVKEEPGSKRGLSGYGLHSPVVGREQELSLLLEAVERTYVGQGGIVGVIGEAGLGKTRLVTELLGQIQPHIGQETGVLPRILIGTTLSYGQTISFWPFQEILRQWAGVTERDSHTQTWQKLAAQLHQLLPGEVEELLPFLGSLLALELPEEWKKRLQYLEAEALGKQIFLAVRRLFDQMVYERPLVLVFEDLHWMDETSTRLVEFLLPLVQDHPLLILGLSRPLTDTPAAHLREVIARDFGSIYQEVRLAPLSASESDRLVKNLLELKEIPSRYQGRILSKAEGNPFYIEEVVRTLIEAKAIARDPAAKTWKITEGVEQIAIPDTIQGVIMARLDRLEEELKHVLGIAAVIGRSFFYTVLRAIETQDEHLDRSLEDLQQIELILERQPEPDLEYIFKHALVQEAMYGSILLKKRKELHLRVGQVVESLFADRLEEFYGLLAYHFARAESWEKAQSYLVKAGDEAGRMAADAEALSYYRQATEAYQSAFGNRWDSLERATLERKIGEALWRRGEQLQALEHLEAGLSFLGITIPKSPPRIYLGILKEATRQLAHRLFPRIFLPAAATPSQTVVEEVMIYEVIAWIEAYNNAERFLVCSLRELNLAEKHGFDLGIVLSSTGVGVMGLYIAYYPLAKRYLDLAEGAAERVDQPVAKGMVHYGLAIYQLCLGDLDRAIAHGLKSENYYHQARDLHGVFLAKAAQGLTHLYKGQLLRAKQVAEEVLEQSQAVSDQMGLAQGYGVLGITLLSLGEDLDITLEILEQALKTYQEVLFHMGAVATLGALGRLYVRKGDVQQALEVLRESKKVVKLYTVSVSYIISFVYIGYAEAYLLAVEQATAEEKVHWMKKARRASRELLKHTKSFVCDVPEAFRLQGVYEWLNGNPGKARQWWERSLQKAELFDLPHQAALTRLEMGRRLGDEAQSKRAKAQLVELGVRLEPSRGS
jgi:class 3 adenylate cyclase/tetratricopeptide (TPR) repeat protein